MKVWVKLYTLKQLLRLIKLLNENNISKKKLKEQKNLIRLNFHLKLFKKNVNKVFNLETSETVCYFGKVENACFLHVCLFHGITNKPKAIITLNRDEGVE